MATVSPGSKTITQGHVALYAKNTRWRRAIARSLGEAGHSYQEVGSPDEIGRLLNSQRFDVLALRVSDDADAQEVAHALEGVSLPPNSIFVGSVSALPTALSSRRPGTLRLVPGALPAREVSRLVDISISAGTWDDGAADPDATAQVEEVDVEDEIERAASAVYAAAKRKGQRFSTIVEGHSTHALATAARLRRSLAALLKLAVTLAPRNTLVAVEARAGRDEWLVRIRAGASRTNARDRAAIAEALNGESRALAQISDDIRRQGGLLWVELAGPAALALCFTLPLPVELEQRLTS